MDLRGVAKGFQNLLSPRADVQQSTGRQMGLMSAIEACTPHAAPPFPPAPLGPAVGATLTGSFPEGPQATSQEER